MNGLKLWTGMLTNVTAATDLRVAAITRELADGARDDVQGGAGGWQALAFRARVGQECADRDVAIGVAMAAWLAVGCDQQPGRLTHGRPFLNGVRSMNSPIAL